MTFDSLAKYTEESIGVCKDFIWFLKKKAQLDAEYSKNISKLCQTGLNALSNGAAGSSAGVLIGGLMGGSIPGSPALGSQNNVVSSSPSLSQSVASGSKEDRLLVLKTSLWKSFNDSIAQLNESASAMRLASGGMITDIINPVQMYIKDMETARRTIMEESSRQTRELQENYTALKKAKQIHDDALSAFNDAKEALIKAQRSPNVKDKELEKLKQRVQQCQEKYEIALATHRQAEDTCKIAQQTYYKQTMPGLLEMLYRKEEDRCTAMLANLRIWQHLERQTLEGLNRAVNAIGDAVDSVEVQADLEDIYADHMEAGGANAEDLFRGGNGNISVRSIVNPVKSGRLWKKAETHDSWKQRFFILAGDRTDVKDPAYQPGSGRIYYFDSEDALKPKGIIDLGLAAVYSVDQSMHPEWPHLFVISYHSAASTENSTLVRKHRDYYLSAESAEEKAEWIMRLRRYSLCCVPCVSAALMDRICLNYNPPSDAYKLPKPTQRESGLRLNRSLRLWIMEGRDLNSLLLEHQAAAAASTYSGGGGGGAGTGGGNDSNTITASGAILNSLTLQQRGTLNTYVSVSFNSCTIARTSTKTSAAPFYGDDFALDDLSSCETELRLSLRQLTRRGEVELGYVVIPVERFKQPHVDSGAGNNSVHKKFDGWIPLLSTAANGEATDSGASESFNSGNPGLRIAAIYSEEILLPLTEYSGMLFCLSDFEFRTLQAFSRCTDRCIAFARDDFAKSLVKILAGSDLDMQAIKRLASLEVENTDDPNIIFRGNTLITKLLDQFMKFHGAEFLKDTLSGPIKLIYERAARQESCEVDPTRLDRVDDEILRKHQKRITNMVQIFWDAIQNSVSKCPPKIREALSIIRETVAESFAKRINPAVARDVQFSCVSGFIFLRFFCPAILSPKMFELWPEMSESANASRTLTLIAKTIQNLANLSDFRVKEPFMEFMNPFIYGNLDQMKVCILQLSSRTARSNAGSTNGAASSGGTSHLSVSQRSDLSRDFNNMYLLIKNNLPELRQLYEELQASKAAESSESIHRLKFRDVDSDALEKVFKTINTMNTMNQLYYQAFIDGQMAIAKQPHIEKQFAALTNISAIAGPPSSRIAAPKRSANNERSTAGATDHNTSVLAPILVSNSREDLPTANFGTGIRRSDTGNSGTSSLTAPPSSASPLSNRVSKKLPRPPSHRTPDSLDLGELSKVVADVLNERLVIDGGLQFDDNQSANQTVVSPCSTIVGDEATSPRFVNGVKLLAKDTQEDAPETAVPESPTQSHGFNLTASTGSVTGGESKSFGQKLFKRLTRSASSLNSGSDDNSSTRNSDDGLAIAEAAPARPPKDWPASKK